MSRDEKTKASSITPIMIDPYKHLHIIPNPDGSVTRIPQDTTSFLTSSPSNTTPVLSKDLTINPSNNTWARLYLPHHALSSSSKLPLIIFFQGGGFVFNAYPALFHNSCFDLAFKVNTFIVSVNYRLAPEHKLPAAYDDALEALMWLTNASDEWFSQCVDFSKCYLMGGSAGANIVYNVGLRVVEGIYPLKIQGMILHQPFFGGEKRTESELKLADNKILPLCVIDLAWELALPKGVDKDHEYCNPMVKGGSDVLEKLRLMGWRVMVVGCDGNPLFDRQVEFARMLEKKGVSMESWFSEGACHGAELVEPSTYKKFIY